MFISINLITQFTRQFTSSCYRKLFIQLKTFEKLPINTKWLLYNSNAGTYILVLFGAGSIAQSVLSLGHKGDFFSINWGYVKAHNNYIFNLYFP